jgi:hypothetical protein
MTWKPPIVQQNNYTLQQKSTFYRNSSAVRRDDLWSIEICSGWGRDDQKLQ